MGVESSLEGPLCIARSQYERPIEPAALPTELVDLTRHPYAEARVGAVAEVSRLLASNNPGMRLSARLTLESMINDDSRKVSDRARAALRERSITGPVAVEAVRQQLASEAEPVPESEPVPGSEQETLPGSVLGREVVERGERLPVLVELLERLGVLRAELLTERLECELGVLSGGQPTRERFTAPCSQLGQPSFRYCGVAKPGVPPSPHQRTMVSRRPTVAVAEWRDRVPLGTD